MSDPKEIEKILRGPHKYMNGTYVSTEYVHQEYPKTMDGTSLPASIVNSKAEEVAWKKRQRKQKVKNALNSALKVFPRLIERLLGILTEAFIRAKT
jgi:hypothetical protein